jgi:signal transduction histidine kinase
MRLAKALYLMQNILVIDDEPPLRQLIMAALKVKGYSIFEAENGSIGVQLAKAHLPDLILCDVMMPKMDGYAVLAALRQDTNTASIPCVLMTGRPDSAGMRHGMTLGADDYLAKPFSIEELNASVAARLKKAQMLKQAAEKKLADLRANISLALPHELFTPLSGIIGFAEIISTDSAGLQPAEIAEIGKAIYASGKRLYRLIENFLIYAQIEMLGADPQKIDALRQSHTPVAHDVLESCALQESQRLERSADLVLELQSGSAAILEEYLRKIVCELLDNAFKFSEPGTPVIVRSSVGPHGFTFSVIDRGHGMTPEQIANVGAYMQFERKFYEQQGSGLGLAIGSRLAEIHGGTLLIENTPGNGTTVTVTLPDRSKS